MQTTAPCARHIVRNRFLLSFVSDARINRLADLSKDHREREKERSRCQPAERDRFKFEAARQPAPFINLTGGGLIKRGVSFRVREKGRAGSCEFIPDEMISRNKLVHLA